MNFIARSSLILLIRCQKIRFFEKLENMEEKINDLTRSVIRKSSTLLNDTYLTLMIQMI